MPQPGCDVNVIVAVMYQMEAPEEAAFVHHKMYQPAAEIKRKNTNDDLCQHTRIEPIHEAKIVLVAPVR